MRLLFLITLSLSAELCLGLGGQCGKSRLIEHSQTFQRLRQLVAADLADERWKARQARRLGMLFAVLAVALLLLLGWRLGG